MSFNIPYRKTDDKEEDLRASAAGAGNGTISRAAEIPKSKQGDLTVYNPGPTTYSTMGASSGSSGGKAQTDSFSYGDYEASEAVKQAEALLQQQMANKPGEYQSSWQAQLDEIMNQILNRQPFEYDLNGDALYQQYKGQAIQQGRMAMMDTMGQAAAMTGGYGSSYAQSVGQQAYQNHLQGLNDVIPELYQLALSKYNQDGQNMLDQFAMIGAREDQDYARYRDSVSDYNSDLDRYLSQYYAERDYDYGKWADGRDFAYGQYSDDRAYAYQQERDRIADEQWQKEYDEQIRQYNQTYALNASKASGSSGRSSGSGGSGGGGGGDDDTAASKYGNMSYTQLMQEMSKAGTTEKGAALADAMISGGADPETVYSLYKMFFDHDPNGTENRRPSKNPNEYITMF